MKKAFLFLSLLMIVAVACDVSITLPTSPTALPTDTVIPATFTPEVFIGLTQAVPAHVELGPVMLAVQEARFGDCELAGCPPSPAGTHYLLVTLQALNLPVGESLDYKNLPQGIAIHDNTGVNTPYNRIYRYAHAAQQLTLYFAVPENGTAFGLQWPGAAEIPLAVAPAGTSVTPQPAFEGVEIAVSPLRLVLPPAVASGVRGNQVPRADGQDLPAWGKTPGHTLFTLEGYALQNRSHQPEIYVYPAQAYVEMLPTVFESIHRLDNILYSPDPQLNSDQLPMVPSFNAQQAFASNIALVPFQNGQGVRFVTEYAQYPAPANNQDLFYHFQGLTRDGAYYIIAILPISNPNLAETSDAGAPLPAGGVLYSYLVDPNADMQLYYKGVVEVLNATPPDAFTPTLQQLDALIQSMQVTP
jgi:hypothetical protein